MQQKLVPACAESTYTLQRSLTRVLFGAHVSDGAAFRSGTVTSFQRSPAPPGRRTAARPPRPRGLCVCACRPRTAWGSVCTAPELRPRPSAPGRLLDEHKHMEKKKTTVRTSGDSSNAINVLAASPRSFQLTSERLGTDKSLFREAVGRDVNSPRARRFESRRACWPRTPVR